MSLSPEPDSVTTIPSFHTCRSQGTASVAGAGSARSFLQVPSARVPGCPTPSPCCGVHVPMLTLHPPSSAGSCGCCQERAQEIVTLREKVRRLSRLLLTAPPGPEVALGGSDEASPGSTGSTEASPKVMPDPSPCAGSVVGSDAPLPRAASAVEEGSHPPRNVAKLVLELQRVNRDYATEIKNLKAQLATVQLELKAAQEDEEVLNHRRWDTLWNLGDGEVDSSENLNISLLSAPRSAKGPSTATDVVTLPRLDFRKLSVSSPDPAQEAASKELASRAAAAEQQLGPLRKAVADLEQEKASVARQLISVYEQCGSLEKQVVMETSKWMKFQEEIDSLRQLTEQSKAETRALEEEVSKWKAQCKQYEDDLQAVRRDGSVMLEQKQWLEQRVRELKSAEETLCREKQDLADRLRSVDHINTVLASELQRQREDLTSQNTSLQDALHHLKTAASIAREVPTTGAAESCGSEAAIAADSPRQGKASACVKATSELPAGRCSQETEPNAALVTLQQENARLRAQLAQLPSDLPEGKVVVESALRLVRRPFSAVCLGELRTSAMKLQSLLRESVAAPPSEARATEASVSTTTDVGDREQACQNSSTQTLQAVRDEVVAAVRDFVERLPSVGSDEPNDVRLNLPSSEYSSLSCLPLDFLAGVRSSALKLQGLLNTVTSVSLETEGQQPVAGGDPACVYPGDFPSPSLQTACDEVVAAVKDFVERLPIASDGSVEVWQGPGSEEPSGLDVSAITEAVSSLCRKAEKSPLGSVPASVSARFVQPISILSRAEACTQTEEGFSVFQFLKKELQSCGIGHADPPCLSFGHGSSSDDTPNRAYASKTSDSATPSNASSAASGTQLRSLRLRDDVPGLSPFSRCQISENTHPSSIATEEEKPASARCDSSVPGDDKHAPFATTMSESWRMEQELGILKKKLFQAEAYAVELASTLKDRDDEIVLLRQQWAKVRGELHWWRGLLQRLQVKRKSPCFESSFKTAAGSVETLIVSPRPEQLVVSCQCDDGEEESSVSPTEGEHSWVSQLSSEVIMLMKERLSTLFAGVDSEIRESLLAGSADSEGSAGGAEAWRTIRAMHEKTDELRAQCDEAKQRVTALEAEVKAWEEKYAALEQNLTHSKEETSRSLQAQQTTYLQLLSEKHSLNLELKERIEENQRLRGQRTELQARVEALQRDAEAGQSSAQHARSLAARLQGISLDKAYTRILQKIRANLPPVTTPPSACADGSPTNSTGPATSTSGAGSSPGEPGESNSGAAGGAQGVG
eukprot:RCo011485